jgi:RHS repeat-associated protein
LREQAELNRVGSCSTGKERDAESGNDYFGARYYASSMGRFMSPDWSAQEEPVPYAKLENPQSLNLYSYVYNNPLARGDADGHSPPIDQVFEMAEDSPAGQAVGNWLESNGTQAINWAGATAAAGFAWGSGLLKAGWDATVDFASKNPGLASGSACPTCGNPAPVMLRNEPATPAATPADEGEPHAPGDVINGQTIVRGGQGAPPSSGEYSGAQGATVEEAGKGVPNGTISVTTSDQIRAAGGTVRPKPEPAYQGGPMNGQHVNITGGQSTFSTPRANPVPKSQRIPGGNTLPKPPNPNSGSN